MSTILSARNELLETSLPLSSRFYQKIVWNNKELHKNVFKYIFDGTNIPIHTYLKFFDIESKKSLWSVTASTSAVSYPGSATYTTRMVNCWRVAVYNFENITTMLILGQ